MIKIESNIEEFKKEVRTNVENLKKIIDAATLKEALRIQSEIRIEWPVDTGESRQQIIVREVQRKDGVEYQVIANSEQAKYIDNIDPKVKFVRAPGSKTPPLDVIAAWAKRKGIVSGNNYDQLDNDQKSTVYLIARALAERGVKNAKIFYTVMTKEGKIIEANITAEVNRNFK